MDKNLFGFLKSRAIFTRGGAKDLHEFMTAQEKRSENRLRERKAVKKVSKK